MKKLMYSAILLFSLATMFTGCRETKESKAEDAIEDVADDVGDAIDDAADEIEDAVD